MTTTGTGITTTIADLQGVAIVVLDDRGRIVEANAAAFDLLGPALSGLTGEPVNLLREDGASLDVTDHPVLHTLRTGEAVEGAIIGLRVDEKPHWLRVSTSVANRRVLAAFVDVTPLVAGKTRAQPDDAVRAWAECPLPLWLVDQATLEVVAVGGAIEQTPVVPARGTRLTDLFASPDDAALLEATLRGAFAGREFAGRFHLRNEAGPPTQVELRGRVIRANGGLYSVVTVLDLAHEEQLERQLRQAQKMEAIGRLAGGVAHDFNNILTAIAGYSQILISALPEGGRQREWARQVALAADQATSLTQQLLAFSRRQVLSPIVVDVGAVVAGMEMILQRVIGEDIELVIDAAADLGRVRADRGQLQQVIMNLAVNARDAMPRGGRLTIAAANTELDAAYIAVHPGSRAGRFVRLSIADTGTGMDTETLTHLFEPFFTTKGPGAGTGLGLSTVYGIVKQSEGYITVNSMLGRGSTFEIYLPIVDDVEAADERAAQAPVVAAGGNELVLLAEDDPTVRTLVVTVLEALGYRVIATEDGEAALEALAAGPEVPDILLTDVVMPRMGGRELAIQVEQRLPGVPVLYMSGYADEAVVRHGLLDAEMHFLQKPFLPDVLAVRVRELLDSRGTAPQ